MPGPRKSLFFQLFFRFFAFCCISIGYVSISFAQVPRLMLPFGHNARVLTTEFSPEGKKFLTASVDRTVKLWDMSSGNLLANFSGHEGEVEAACFSSDGNFILTGGGAKLFLWNAQTGRKIREFQGLESYITSARFSPDLKRVYAGLANGVLQAFEVSSGKLLATLDGNIGKSVRSEMDNVTRLIMKEFDKINLDELDEEERKELEEEKKEALKEIERARGNYLPEGGIIPIKLSDLSSIVFSHDRKMILTTVRDGIKIWNAASFKLIREIKREGMKDLICAFNPDNSEILCFSPGGFIDIWNIKTGKKRMDLDNSGKSRVILSGYLKNEKLFGLFENGTLKLFNTRSGKLLKEWKAAGPGKKVSLAAVSLDLNYLYAAQSDGSIIKTHIETGERKGTYTGHREELTSINFSIGHKMMITSSKDKTVKVWNEETGQILWDKNETTDGVLKAFTDTENARMAVSRSDGRVEIWEPAKGRILLNHVVTDKKFEYARFKNNTLVIGLNNGTYLPVDTATPKNEDAWIKENNMLFGFRNKDARLTPTERLDFTDLHGLLALENQQLNTIARVYKAGKPSDYRKIEFVSDHTPNKSASQPYFDLDADDALINFAKFSPDGLKILTVSANSKANIWHGDSGRDMFTLIGHEDNVIYGDFNSSGQQAITTSQDGTAKIWELKRGELQKSLNGHTSGVYSAQFFDQDRKVLTASADNTCKVWNTSTGQTEYTFFTVGKNNPFFILPNGYYMGDPAAIKQLNYVTEDLKLISFEQLDVKYNRPDKVLAKIADSDTTLIRAYRRAYLKRIEKLGIDTTVFREDYRMPELDFVNAASVARNQTTGKLQLHIRAKDENSRLLQLNVWVNEVPLYGQKGKTLRPGALLDTTITLDLSYGANRIEASVRNANGIESYRKPLIVNFTPKNPPVAKLYFIGIGIDLFRDASKNLNYSVKDIKTLAEEFKKKYGNAIVIDTLLNHSVTRENVARLKKRLLGTDINDRVILAFSGHGLVSGNMDYYLSTYSTDFAKPETGGLPYEELETLLDGIPARNKLFLLDACHSGEIDKSSVKTEEQPQPAEQKGKKGGKAPKKNEVTKGGGKSVKNENAHNLGLENSFELMQRLFVNVGRGTGATVFAAAAGSQSAYESSKLEHGIFTWFILQALKTYPKMNLSQLKQMIAEGVEKESMGKQTPVSRHEMIAVDWPLW